MCLHFIIMQHILNGRHCGWLHTEIYFLQIALVIDFFGIKFHQIDFLELQRFKLIQDYFKSHFFQLTFEDPPSVWIYTWESFFRIAFQVLFYAVGILLNFSKICIFASVTDVRRFSFFANRRKLTFFVLLSLRGAIYFWLVQILRFMGFNRSWGAARAPFLNF